MDLTVSPDVDAFYCYLLVTSLGLFTGYIQVNKYLGDKEGIWFIHRTWILLLLFAAIPVALFWFLDLTGATNDTALLAAVVVGLGYERILAGESESIQQPGAVSKLSTPFLAYAEALSNLTLKQAQQLEVRRQNKIIELIAQDKARYETLVELVETRGDDVYELVDDLHTIDENELGLSDQAVREQKARRLYEHAMYYDDDAHVQMREKGVIDNATFYWEIRDWRRRSASILTAITFVFVTSILVFQFALSNSDTVTQYDLWRLGKIENSKKDQFRAQDRLSARLHDTDQRTRILNRLLMFLQRPELPKDNAKLALEVVVRSRESAPKGAVEIAPYIYKALRTPNAHSRDIANQSLVYLSKRQCVALERSIKEWNPKDGDTIAIVEQKIDAWRAYWDTVEKTACRMPSD